MTFSHGSIAEVQNYVFGLPVGHSPDCIRAGKAPPSVAKLPAALLTDWPDPPPILEQLATALRCGTSQRMYQAGDDLCELFDAVWVAEFAKMVLCPVLREQPVLAVDSRFLRVITPKYPIDTARLGGREVAAVLQLPRALAQETRNHPAEFCTQPRLDIGIQAYMFEAFSWLDLIKPVAEIPSSADQPTVVEG